MHDTIILVNHQFNLALDSLARNEYRRLEPPAPRAEQEAIYILWEEIKRKQMQLDSLLEEDDGSKAVTILEAEIEGLKESLEWLEEEEDIYVRRR